MFKKNPLRPPVVVELRRLPNGYKVIPSEAVSLFHIKKVTRTMFRPDLIQGANIEAPGISSTIIQPPSHVTLPAFAGWFSLDSVHQIQRQFFPEFFEPNVSEDIFSFSIKNSRLYRYYRNTIVGMWRENVKKYLSSGHCRRNLVGDVSSIIRIHGFLQNWGLINFSSKEHNKGIVAHKAERLSCYVCQAIDGQIFYVASVEDVLFQLCSACFSKRLYSDEFKPSDFAQVHCEDYKQPQRMIMNNSQIIKMLEILSTVSGGSNRQRDREAWQLVQKQFPNFTRQEIIFNFLRIPTCYEMNANIFDNNQDASTQHTISLNHQPSIFQDFQNPIQASIAIGYYQLQKSRKNGEKSQKLQKIFKAAQHHARILAIQQAQKIDQVTKMMVEVSYSKLENKTLFINQYEKLIEKNSESRRRAIMNTLAESLKQNMRLMQRQEEPEQLWEQQLNGDDQLYV